MNKDGKPALTQSLAELKQRHRDLRVIAPARTKDALIAAIYLALDAPEDAADTVDALADVVNDLEWLPEAPVRLAWVTNPALPSGVQRQVLAVLTEAAQSSARSARPLSIYLVTA